MVSPKKRIKKRGGRKPTRAQRQRFNPHPNPDREPAVERGTVQFSALPGLRDADPEDCPARAAFVDGLLARRGGAA